MMMIPYRRRTSVLAMMILVATVVLLGATPTGADTAATDESVTLKVSNAPLSEALNRVSNSTGWRIFVDERWSGTPVSASFDDLPLEKGLKRLLKNFDHAIVFESERSIRIIIYGESGSSAGYSSGFHFVAAPDEDIEPASESEPLPLAEPLAGRKKPPRPGAESPSNTATSDTDAEQTPSDEIPDAADENARENRSGQVE